MNLAGFRNGFVANRSGLCKPATFKSTCAGLYTTRGAEAARDKPTTARPRHVLASAGVFAYDTVTAVFTTYNTLLLVPWCMMVFVPNLDFTRSVIKSNAFLYTFCGLFLYLFAAATVEAVDAGANLSEEVRFLFLEAVADPYTVMPTELVFHNVIHAGSAMIEAWSKWIYWSSGDPKKMAAMFSPDRPTYAAQDWAHLCTWDYFVGYWIYLQGQDKNIFTRHSLLLTFNSGPPGLICHFITEAITDTIRSRSSPPPAATDSQPTSAAAEAPQEAAGKSQE